MDSNRFDRLARTLSSRRTALGGLFGGGLLATLELVLTADDAGSAGRRCGKGKKPCGKRCIPKKKCCTNANCRPKGSGKVCKNGTCRCPRRTKLCDNRCIPGDLCCTSADCPGGGACQNGLCGPACTGDCEGKSCGGDGCGGSCGTCGNGTSCVGGTCQPGCTPSCAGRTCGGNGCGGSCGTCGGGFTCVNGNCQSTCTPSCAGKTCGTNGCGGSCGTCVGGSTCVGGNCQPTCTPSCAGKNCGGDGCGGSCGTCSGGRICSNPTNGGTCQCPAVTCGETCCAAGKSCFGGACWPDAEELAFVSLINNHRAANGRAALTLQNQLGASAELHSQDQAANNFSSHTGSDGSSPDQRITRAGYAFSWWAENIYWGGGTASDAFTWWRNSAGHNANMLDTNFTQLGIGRAQSSAGVWYWTTTFGRPR